MIHFESQAQETMNCDYRLDYLKQNLDKIDNLKQEEQIQQDE